MVIDMIQREYWEKMYQELGRVFGDEVSDGKPGNAGGTQDGADGAAATGRKSKECQKGIRRMWGVDLPDNV